MGKKKELDKNLIGKKFHKLTIIDFSIGERNRQKLVCECECGNIKIANPNDILSGHLKSCGCLRNSSYDKYKYLIGQKINKWDVLELKEINKKCYAICQCECGNVREIYVYNLISNLTKDCGCGRKRMLTETKSNDLVGERFGKLVVIEKLEESNKFKRILYRCLCDCGNEIIQPSSSLTTGHTNSCGCILSYYNMYIDKLLDEMDVEHQTEYYVKYKGYGFRFDFYLPQFNAMIEYDGEQHFKPVNYGQNDQKQIEEKFEKTKRYDQLKNEYCERNNINLLRIPYWEKQNIDKIIHNYLQRLSEKGFID